MKSAQQDADTYYTEGCACGFVPAPFHGSHTQQCADEHFGKHVKMFAPEGFKAVVLQGRHLTV